MPLACSLTISRTSSTAAAACGPGTPGGDALGDAPHDEQTEDPISTEKKGVDVQMTKSMMSFCGVSRGVEVGQVVNDIFAGGRRVRCCFVACCDMVRISSKTLKTSM